MLRHRAHGQVALLEFRKNDHKVDTNLSLCFRATCRFEAGEILHVDIGMGLNFSYLAAEGSTGAITFGHPLPNNP
ncbi:MAG: hypothetical protein LBI39_02640 [Puniceicoccales bacterium]|nr:hypothetical protein [Puniceicoccales bacterium]